MVIELHRDNVGSALEKSLWGFLWEAPAGNIQEPADRKTTAARRQDVI
jgi:hypothetical protein